MTSITHNLLGVEVNLLNMKELNSLIGKAVNLNAKWIIANHNLNSLYIYHHNSIMRDFYRIVNYAHVDGMALILMGKLLNIPCRREHRVTYADWIWSLMAEAAKNKWRILYLGSKPGIAERGASVLKSKYPNLQIATLHGYFSQTPVSLENKSIIEKINFYQPHVLMVGMGMPRQENWILNNIDKIKANVILPSGACMDYVAGEVATPPRWMGKIGLEWLYRLMCEPRRLWKRYLLEPWFIAFIFVEEYFTHLKNMFFQIVQKNVK